MNKAGWSSILVVTLVLFFGVAAEAQQSKKVQRVGILLLVSTREATAHLVEAFRHGLRDFGYVEGRNITVEQRFGEGKVERLSDLAADLVRLNVDVIVAATHPQY